MCLIVKEISGTIGDFLNKLFLEIGRKICLFVSSFVLFCFCVFCLFF